MTKDMTDLKGLIAQLAEGRTLTREQASTLVSDLSVRRFDMPGLRG